MSGERMAWLGMIGAVVTGLVCSLVLPLAWVVVLSDPAGWSGEDVRDFVDAWLRLGLGTGLLAGLVLGVLPTVVAMTLWARLDPGRDAGERVRGASIAIAAVATVEAFVVLLWLGLAVWAVPAAVVVGLVAGAVSGVLLWLNVDRTATDGALGGGER